MLSRCGLEGESIYWLKLIRDFRAFEEVTHEIIFRESVYVLRCVDLFKDSIPHHRDPIRHGHGIGEIVGHIDRRRFEILV